MSSEILGVAENTLKGNLGGAWDIKHGYADAYTDLGVARRFGGAAAAYSLRDIGAMNGRVVNVRREPHDDDDPGLTDETDFSANQVQSGALEDWVNGKLENTLPADVATAAAAYSLRRVSSNSNVYTGDYSSGVDGIISPAAGSAVTVTGNIDGISDGSTSKDNVLKIENNATVCPQLSLVRDNYQLTRSGQVTFTYYVPSGHPIIGKFWQIGSHDAGANAGSRGARIRTNIGVQIVGGTWTEVTLSYGSQYGGTDKFTDAFGSEFITITNEAEPNVLPFVEATANDGDIYYISAISVSATPLFPLRIRRSSDNVEVNVAFDSDDKISNSSLVENETEEGGESGSTTATTLGDFISGTDAFVHTWYDQAGSNNAVQDTDANQPKIAESGALLADGLLFDDSNDFLQSSSQVLTGTTNNSLYCVVKTLSDNGYIAGSAGTGVGMSIYAGTTKFILSNNNSAGTSTQDTIPMVNGQNVLVSANFDDGTTDSLHLNANANGYANGSSSYSITAGTKFTIGARDGSTAEAVMYKGSIQEVIAYDSFQGANRFKIESNINNYYGLYNDANDLSSTSFTVSGGTLSGSNTTDGFTCTTTTSSEVRANFKNPIPSLSSNSSTFHMSFNADLANPAGSSGNGSPIVRLLNSSEAVTIAAHTVTQGFNSFSNVVNQNAGTDSTILEFFDNDANTSYSISDIKISLIARNGFVETWYDQSGNGNNATQATASDQPMIIRNGGQNKILNGTPSIAIDRNSSIRQLDIATEISTEPYTFFLTGFAPTTRKTQYFSENSAGNRPVFLVGSAGINYAPDDSTATGNVTSGSNGNADFVASAFSGVNSGANYIVRFNGTQIASASRGQAGDGIQSIGRFDTTEAAFGHIESWVLYASDLTADFDEIENQLAQPIGLI